MAGNDRIARVLSAIVYTVVAVVLGGIALLHILYLLLKASGY